MTTIVFRDGDAAVIVARNAIAMSFLIRPDSADIPPAWLLFASGLGALGLFGWGRKKAAALAA